MHGLFFLNRRLLVRCEGGRLIRYKASGKRVWRLKLAWMLERGDAEACGGAILSSYQHLLNRDNNAWEVTLSSPGEQAVDIFTGRTGNKPLLRLRECVVSECSMEWEAESITFHLSLEHELSDQLHGFVKDHTFAQFFVEFEPAQMNLLDETVRDAVDKLQDTVDHYGAAVTLCDDTDGTLLELKPKGRVQ